MTPTPTPTQASEAPVAVLPAMAMSMATVPEEEVKPVVSVTTRAAGAVSKARAPRRTRSEKMGRRGELSRRSASPEPLLLMRSSWIPRELARVPRLTSLLLDGAGARAATGHAPDARRLLQLASASSPPLVAAASSPRAGLCLLTAALCSQRAARSRRRPAHSVPPSPPCSSRAGPGVPEPSQGELEERWHPAASSHWCRGAWGGHGWKYLPPSPKLAPAQPQPDEKTSLGRHKGWRCSYAALPLAGAVCPEANQALVRYH
ncbi:hypothetical protein VPH35_098478 [Triticum aestivum]